MTNRSFRFHELDCEREEVQSKLYSLEKKLKLQSSRLLDPLFSEDQIMAHDVCRELETQIADSRRTIAEIESQQLSLRKDQSVSLNNKEQKGTTWAALPNEAKSILEWTEHVYTGQRQILVIKRGEPFTRFGLNIPVTDYLFKEILAYISASNYFAYDKNGDAVKVVLKKKTEMAC
jgi:hypothetical protein